MSVYHVIHSTSGCPYTITEKGEMCTVSWEDRGRGAGKVEYRCTQVQDYLARGVWKLLKPNSCEEVDQPVLGVARPVLGTRKVGKVQVNLVDQGFPNALMELAKMLTVCGEIKQYKPHDWKNLPDPEFGFQGAASRHRMEHNIARVAGTPAGEITDHESKILHKAHEAFNVLAELELILTKKIV